VQPCGGRKVTVMAAAGGREPVPDLYQLLGVDRDASQAEITMAWRRRAREQHPDSRPGDAQAPGRFRALAGARQVLGDPARRAAYDRVLGSGQPAGRVRVTVRRTPGPAGTGATPPARVPGPPLVAGPVRVEGHGPAPVPGRDEEQIRLAVLAGLALRYLARDRGRAW
jgi:curved DNA-binding protein CbpA